jgi:hypothetical protein
VSAFATAIAETSDWLLAARVDLRLGEIIERHSAPSGSGLVDEDGVLFTAIEMLRSRANSRQVFLLAERHVHLYERSASDPQLAVVFVAGRATNLGLLLASLRRVSRGGEA